MAVQTNFLASNLKPIPFADADDVKIILFVKFGDALLSGLSLMSRIRVGIEVVWIDLKRNQIQRFQRSWFNNGQSLVVRIVGHDMLVPALLPI